MTLIPSLTVRFANIYRIAEWMKCELIWKCSAAPKILEEIDDFVGAWCQ